MPAQREVPMEESLEELEERETERVAAHDQDPEVALDELIEELVPQERVPIGPRDPNAPEGPAADEFVCSTCRLVVARRLLAESRTMVCIDCARIGARRVRGAKRRRPGSSCALTA